MDVDNDLETGDTNTYKNQNAEEQAQEYGEITKDLEIKMLFLSFQMRAKILTMGTDVWKTKGFTDEIAAKKLDIEKYIKGAYQAFFYSQFQDTDDNLKNAEKLYDEIDVIMQNKNKQITQEAEKTKELETKMLYLSFQMRAKILTMSTEVWKTKDKFTDEIAAIILDIQKYIKRAKDAWFYSKFQDTDDNLKKAEKLYDDINVIFQPVPVKNHIIYKVTVRGDDRDVLKCIQLAEDFLSKGNIRRAERLLHKAERICPTINARELLKKVEAAKFAAEAETAKEAVGENSSLNTQEPNSKELLYSKKVISNDTKETEPKKESSEKITETMQEPTLKQENLHMGSRIIIAGDWNDTKPTEIDQDEQKSIEAHTLDSKIASKSSYSIFVDKLESMKCESAAKKAVETKDFNKAKKLLQKLQRMDKSIDVTQMLKQVECGLFAANTAKESYKEIEHKSDKTNESRSRGTDTNPSNNKLAEEKIQNSKDKLTSNKATENLKTEIGIQNKQSYHNYAIGNPANDKYDTNNKVSSKNAYATEVAKPSYEQSCYENPFARSLGKTATSSYHLSKYKDEAEDYFKKAQMAHNKNSFDVAEMYALKSEQLYPSVRAKALLDDINRSRNLNQSNYKDEAEDYFKKAQMAYTIKSFDEAEMYALKSEQLNPSVRAKALLDNINRCRNLNSSQRLRSGTVYKTSRQSRPKHSELKEKAEKCLDEAEKAYTDGKIEEAELLLRKSESMNPTKRATVLSQLIQDAKHNPEIIKNAKKDKAIKYVKEAQELFSTGDIDAAENLLVEADTIFSDKKIQNFLERIRHEKAMRASKELRSKCELKPEEKEDANDMLNSIGDNNFSFTTYRAKQVVLNREEADKSIERAEAEIEKGRLGKAERLLKKAERLCPSVRAKDLLRQVEAAKGPEWNEDEEKKESKQARQQKHQDRQQERPKRTGPTPEQLEAIERVKKGRNDYEILGLEENSPAMLVTKAYRRLTLLLHPDKNKAPGAKEAFMVVSESVERLKKKKRSTKN